MSESELLSESKKKINLTKGSGNPWVRRKRRDGLELGLLAGMGTV